MWPLASSLRPSCLVILFLLFLIRVWSQVAIMAQDGFALLKQVAAAHLGNAAVQEQLYGAVRNLATNTDNQVRRPDGGHVVVM
jgi:hypothetical protein